MLVRLVDLLERGLEGMGKAAALLVLAIIGLIVFEMVSRGVFGMPTPWTGDLVSWLLVALVFLGGPWALMQGKFVRVDALYSRFSLRTRTLIDTFISSIFFGLLIWILIGHGYTFAERSFLIGETSATGAWDGPVWIAKALVPFGTSCLALAWLLLICRAWMQVRFGEIKSNPEGPTVNG